VQIFYLLCFFLIEFLDDDKGGMRLKLKIKPINIPQTFPDQKQGSPSTKPALESFRDFLVDWLALNQISGKSLNRGYILCTDESTRLMGLRSSLPAAVRLPLHHFYD